LCIPQNIIVDDGKILEVLTVEVLSTHGIVVGVDAIDLHIVPLLTQDGKKVLGYQSVEQVVIVLGGLFVVNIPPPLGEHISVTESPLAEETRSVKY
jgi:hypothetical protein